MNQCQFWKEKTWVYTAYSVLLLVTSTLKCSEQEALFFKFVDKNNEELLFDTNKPKEGFRNNEGKPALISTSDRINLFYSKKMELGKIFSVASGLNNNQVTYRVNLDQYIAYSKLVSNKENVNNQISLLYKNKKSIFLEDLQLVLKKVLENDEKMQKTGFTLILGEINTSLEEGALVFQEPYGDNEKMAMLEEWINTHSLEDIPNFKLDDEISYIPITLTAIRTVEEEKVMHLKSKIKDLEVQNDQLVNSEKVQKSKEWIAVMIFSLLFILSHLVFSRKTIKKLFKKNQQNS